MSEMSMKHEVSHPTHITTYQDPCTASVQTKVVCEWGQCRFEIVADVDNLTNHFTQHAYQMFQNWQLGLSSLHCGMCESDLFPICCGGEEDATIPLLRHVLFHGYQLRQRSRGAYHQLTESWPTCHCASSITKAERNHVPDLPTALECDWRRCNYTTNNILVFHQHVSLHPNADNPNSRCHRCFWGDCTFATRRSYTLQQHMITHSMERPWACPQCGVGFCQKRKLRDHLQRQLVPYTAVEVQEPQQPRQQPVTLTFMVDGMAEHFALQDEHFLFVPISSEAPDCPAAPTPAVVEVQPCPQNVALVGQTAHVNPEPPSIPPPQQNLVRPQFQCLVCGRCFASQTFLTVHMRRHVSTIRCSLCPYTCPSNYALRRHMFFRHQSQRPIVCEQCSFCCKSGDILQRHIQYFHKDGSSNASSLSGSDSEGGETDVQRRSSTKAFALPFRSADEATTTAANDTVPFSQRKLTLAPSTKYKDFRADKPQTSSDHRGVLATDNNTLVNTVKRMRGRPQTEQYLYACHLCEKRFRRGYCLSKHALMAHQLAKPPGFSRFCFKLCDDGFYRMQTTRLESWELT